jgi:indolepyruvate ferredoxin oxidoreductase
VEPGHADVLLVFDSLVAVDARNLAKATRERTVAVIAKGVAPTGAMVRDVHSPAIDEEALVEVIDTATTPGRNLRVPSQEIATRIVGDALLANSVLIGAALQAGLLPVSQDALLAAVDETGRSAGRTRAAIGWGRTFVARPQLVLDMLAEGRSTTITVDPGIGARTAGLGLSPSAEQVVAELATDLLAYQGRRLAAGYVETLGHLSAVEAAVGLEGAPVTVAAARGLHKVLAYKDEYEVARLHLDPAFETMLANEFGDGTVRYHLHPPILRAMGLKRKLVLGPSFRPGFRILRVMRHLRGTPVDPFGFAKVRRTERRLIEEYMALIRLAEQRLTQANVPDVVQLLSSVDMVRGYEDIKLANVDRYREHVDELVSRLDQPRVDADQGATDM